jgi:dihydroorotate dehydrogenase
MGAADFILADVKGLVGAIVRKTSQGQIVRELGRDKQTVRRWLDGSQPSDDRDIASLIRLALRHGIEIDSFQTFNPIYDFSEMLSYEEKLQKGGPELLWLADPAIPLPGYPVELCGLKTDSPIGIASSPLMADEKWSSLMLNLGFGISTLKTRRANSKLPWDPPHIAFVREPPSLLKYDSTHPPQVEVTFQRNSVRMPVPNLVNSLGVPSDCPASWQVTYQRIQNHVNGGLVGLSVMGEGETRSELLKDLDGLVSAAVEVNPPFVEVNISCPNLEKECDPYEDLTLVTDVCNRVKRLLQRKNVLFVLKLAYLPEEKLRQLIGRITNVIDAVSFHNTIKVRPVRRDREGHLHGAFPAREFGGLSGPCTFQLTKTGIQSLVRIRKQLQSRFGIIAVGGISTSTEVTELMNLGVDVVQACTAPIFDPLLALKTRFHLSQSRSILRRREEGRPAVRGLLMPRDQTERDSYRELEQAVSEIERRFSGREIPYKTIVSTWNTWMSKRVASMDTGVARRVSAGRKKAEWIQELL